jgi:hypothetical protein
LYIWAHPRCAGTGLYACIFCPPPHNRAKGYRFNPLRGSVFRTTLFAGKFPPFYWQHHNQTKTTIQQYGKNKSAEKFTFLSFHTIFTKARQTTVPNRKTTRNFQRISGVI